MEEEKQSGNDTGGKESSVQAIGELMGFFHGGSKLLPCQKERMAWMREKYDMSYRELARYYNISVSLAFFICNPAAEYKKNARRSQLNKRYYKKEKAVAAVTKSRDKIKSINKMKKH